MKAPLTAYHDFAFVFNPDKVQSEHLQAIAADLATLDFSCKVKTEEVGRRILTIIEEKSDICGP